MSNTNKSSKSGTSDKRAYAPTKWVNVALSEDDRTQLEDMYANHAAIFSWLHDAIQTGLKFSVRYDDKNHTFVASLTQQAGSENLVLTGRGADTTAAILSCLYRHFVLLAGDWSSWNEGATNSLFD